VLLLDDFFLLHEVVIPKLLGIKEKYVVATYPLLIVAFLLFFMSKLLTTSYLVLLSALGFLALSVLTDALSHSYTNELEYLFEDGFKFMGIVGWFYYFTSTSLLILKHSLDTNFISVGEAEEMLV